MRNERNWFGVDSSNEESLLEYGFLMCKAETGSSYEVVYMNGFDEDGNPLYCVSIYDHTFWLQECMDNDGFPDPARMANCCGMTVKDWIDTVKDSPQILLSDLLMYYGNCEILDGYYMKYYTEKEIRERLSKAL